MKIIILAILITIFSLAPVSVSILSDPGINKSDKPGFPCFSLVVEMILASKG